MFFKNPAKILFFLGCLGIFFSTILAEDKIYTQKGDILNMKVEKIDEEYVYATDNLNRLKIPIRQVKYVEYEKPSLVKVDEASLPPGKSALNWQISHYNGSEVFLWNKETGSTMTIPRTDLEERVENIHTGFWGLLGGVELLTPDSYTRNKIDSATGYFLEMANKIEYELLFFSLFFSVRSSFASFHREIDSQGLNRLSLQPNLFINFFRNEFLRAYIGFGFGSVFLHSYKGSSSKSEFTGILDAFSGFEIFILPYWSLRIHYGIEMITQELSYPWLLNYNFSLSTGYYFF